ncbi:MAG: VanZ family protein [Gammaproteobacteria bacterium]|nr:VanZ family protein [Gammaproteobacteria bacterium]
MGGLLVLLVAVLSLSPGGDSPLPFAHADKLVHVSMYLALGAWLACLVRKSIALLLALAAYGIGLEFGQEFVPGRGLDILDMLANVTGAALGIVATRFIWNPYQWLQHRQ